MDLILATPRLSRHPDRLVAGPVRSYDLTTRTAIPAQWQAYDAMPHPAALGPEDYFGVCFNQSGDRFDYLCGQQIAADTSLPDGMQRVTLPGGIWAEFATRANPSTMQAAWEELFQHWMRQPGLAWRAGPAVEYYPPSFNGATGEGGYELWIPLAG